MSNKTLELINTVIIFANKMNFPWNFQTFTLDSSNDIIFGLYVYTCNCDQKISDPIMYWEWYLKDWSEYCGDFPKNS